MYDAYMMFEDDWELLKVITDFLGVSDLFPTTRVYVADMTFVILHADIPIALAGSGY